MADFVFSSVKLDTFTAIGNGPQRKYRLLEDSQIWILRTELFGSLKSLSDQALATVTINFVSQPIGQNGPPVGYPGAPYFFPGPNAPTGVDWTVPFPFLVVPGPSDLIVYSRVESNDSLGTDSQVKFGFVMMPNNDGIVIG